MAVCGGYELDNRATVPRCTGLLT